MLFNTKIKQFVTRNFTVLKFDFRCNNLVFLSYALYIYGTVSVYINFHVPFQTSTPHRMSGNILILKNQFINKNAPLGNGLARFIPQLARMTIKVKKTKLGWKSYDENLQNFNKLVMIRTGISAGKGIFQKKFTTNVRLRIFFDTGGSGSRIWKISIPIRIQTELWYNSGSRQKN